MSYDKINFEDNITPLDAENFNHMEDGIAANADALDDKADQTDLDKLSEDVENLNADLTDLQVMSGTIQASSEIQFTAYMMLLMITYSDSNYGLFGCGSNRIYTYSAGTNTSLEVTSDGNSVYTLKNNHASATFRYFALLIKV